MSRCKITQSPTATYTKHYTNKQRTPQSKSTNMKKSRAKCKITHSKSTQPRSQHCCTSKTKMYRCKITKIQPKTQPNNGEKSNDTTGPKQTHKQSSNIAAHQKRTHIELSNQHAQHHHTNNVTDKRTDHKTNSQHLQTTHEQMNFAKTQQINTTTISAMLHIKKTKMYRCKITKKIQP